MREFEATPTDDGDCVADALRAHGFRATSQRLLIEDSLRSIGRHLTADEVLDAVRERLPGVSLPTVYASLEALEQAGLIRRIAAGRGPALYDARPVPHHHLVCRSCGAVEDLDAHADLAEVIRSAAGRGFSAESAEVVVQGLCAECRAPTTA